MRIVAAVLSAVFAGITLKNFDESIWNTVRKKLERNTSTV